MPVYQDKLFDYAIIGAGPAAICAIPALIAKGISLNQIIWIDSNGFQLGAFGSSLSEGSSVPGNTNVASYKKVNNAIYKILPECKPTHAVLFDELPDDQTCSLSVAAEPMQHISNYLRCKVQTLVGTVININEMTGVVKLFIKTPSNSLRQMTAKKCILCIGAEPKILSSPALEQARVQQNIFFIKDPNIVFIRSRLERYLEAHSSVNRVAVVGSSHSAALAVMNLLNFGVKVKQFMNKSYKFAETCFDTLGQKYIKHDNTGLKGEVASYIKNLLLDINTDQKKKESYQVFLSSDKQEVENLLYNNIHDCQAIVFAIGYETACTLQINNLPLNNLGYNYYTGKINNMDHVFGFGIAYPLEVTAPDGEVEFAVGYGKFWTAANSVLVMKHWLKNATEVTKDAYVD